MLDWDEDPVEVRCCYSVGSYGPFPIDFYRQGEKFYYCPQEHDTRGPFESLDDALEAADTDFGCTDGGFWESFEDAQKHAGRMRTDGFGVE